MAAWLFGSTGIDHAAHQVGLQVRVLGAEDGVRLDNLALPVQGFQVVGHRHQVGFRRQFIGRVTPIGVGKSSKLSAANKGLRPGPGRLEIIRAGFRPVGNGLGQLGSGCRVGFKRGGDIHPIQRMQVVKMDDMILNVLNGFDDVADQAGIGGDLNFQGIFDSSHGAECMYRRSDTANSLGKRPGISRDRALL